VALFRRHISLQAQHGVTYKAEHEKFLRSAEWQKKRQKVMQRANGVCEGCGDLPATQVHHLTYKHWRDEFLFDLAAVCDSCHAKCHPELSEVDMSKDFGDFEADLF
jgi:5-methylcytosine-specific restriction endonuclease McrA